MSVSSQQLNYLIWRYLQESGFELSTYALQQESRANGLENELGEHIPMGALVSLVQKGIQLSEMEARVKKIDRTKDIKPYTLFGALPILSAQAEEQENKDEEEEKQQQANTKPKQHLEETSDEATTNGIETEGNTTNGKISTSEVQVEVEKPVPAIKDLTPIYTNPNTPSQCSQWSPMIKDILAIGQPTDGSATLINFSPTFASSDGKPAMLNLKHSALGNSNQQDLLEVTSISWNYAGNFLVTGSFNGELKMWSSDGRLRHTLSLHKSPIMVIRWNKSGSLLLSMDCSNTVAIWDAFSGEIRQHFPGSNIEGESSSSLPSTATSTDADWIDGITYAVTGDNSSIVVYKVGERIPVLRFQGHNQAVNSIEFDSSSQLLCSGSDDTTVRLWNGKTTVPVKTFYGHTGPVMAVRWINNNSNTENPTQATLDTTSSIGTSLVVSGSMDNSIRVWDINNGACLLTLLIHEAAVFYAEVSPNGKYIASGGLDGVLVIWDVTNIKGIESPGSRRAIARYVCEPETDEHNNNPETRAVSSISWSSDSTRVFVSFAGSSAVVELP